MHISFPSNYVILSAFVSSRADGILYHIVDSCRSQGSRQGGRRQELLRTLPPLRMSPLRLPSHEAVVAAVAERVGESSSEGLLGQERFYIIIELLFLSVKCQCIMYTGWLDSWIGNYESILALNAFIVVIVSIESI